jgi:hypothetical protein
MKSYQNLALGFFISGIALSCIREATCDEAAESYRKQFVNIIVDRNSNNAYSMRLDGRDTKSGRRIAFIRQNFTWAQDFIKEISIGDTVVKHKGELKFNIHKKDTVLVFPFECKGKIYE